MSEQITALPWELPVPSTSLLNEPTIEELRPGLVLNIEYEADSEFVKTPRAGIIRQRLFFEGVVAFKCTNSLLCDVEIINLAYDKLADLGQTEWLSSLQTQPEWLRKELSLDAIRHVAIFFDEGPCHEFICRGISISEEFLPR